jgi:hypothetical protein
MKRAIVLLALAAVPFAAIGAGDEYLDFSSPRVLNLSAALADRARTRDVTHPVDIDSASVQTGPLAPVLDRPEIRLGDREAVAATASKSGEAKRIPGRRGGVTRTGKVLTIAARGGEPFMFRDWAKAATRDADADGEAYVYAGTLRGTGYHRVDVQFAHDSPGTFFVHPGSGRLAFVHVADDLTVLSPDKRRLLVLNNGLNPPFGLVLASLRQDGPAVRMHCQARPEHRIYPSFRGWHSSPAVGFDLALTVRAPGDTEAYEAIPLRFLYLNNEWRILAPDAERLLQLTGFNCWQ